MSNREGERNSINNNQAGQNNNNNGFKVRFGVRRRHRGPPFARGYHQFIIIGGKPGRRGKEKVGTLIGSIVSMCPSWFIKKVYGGKRCVFKEEKNKCRVGQDRSSSGREFQIDGAAKEKERRPFADQMSGTVSRSLSRDLKFRVGM